MLLSAKAVEQACRQETPGEAARLARILSDYIHHACISSLICIFLDRTINPLVPPPHHVGRAAPPDGRGDSHFWRQSGCHRWNSCLAIPLHGTIEQRSHRQDVAPSGSCVCAAEFEEPPVHVACTFSPGIISSGSLRGELRRRDERMNYSLT